jgi:hypothetical protein
MAGFVRDLETLTVLAPGSTRSGVRRSVAPDLDRCFLDVPQSVSHAER